MISLKGSYIAKIFFTIILFFFIYPVKLKGLPFSFRILIAPIGFVWLLKDYLAGNLYISKKILRLLLAIILVTLVSYVSIFIVNDTAEYTYLLFAVPVFTYILSAYAFVKFAYKIYPDFSFHKLALYLITVTLLQAIISIIMFLVPAVNTFLMSIQQLDEFSSRAVTKAIGLKLLGFGESFFALGVFNSVALIFIVILLKNTKQPFKIKMYLILAYLFIFVIGMMQARTTSVGLIMSICYLFFSSFKLRFVNLILDLKIVFRFLAVAAIIFAIFTTFGQGFLNKYSFLIKYGFEMVVNYQESGTLKTGSTEELKTLYIYPDNDKTYLIGDGRLTQVDNNGLTGFYKHTDVGFIRLIFYIGLIGLLLFALFQFILIRDAFLYNIQNSKIIIIYLFLFIIVCNLKGLTDGSIIFIPFWILAVIQQNKKISSSIL